jgi:hypothetical protein
VDVAEFERHAFADHPLLAAGVDEQEVLLPIVEEPKVPLRILPGRAGCGRCWRNGRGRRRRTERLQGGLLRRNTAGDHCRPRGRGAVVGHERADSVEGLRGDAAAVAQPAGELAIVDGAAPKGGFGKAGLPAILRNLLKKFLGVHDTLLRAYPLEPADARNSRLVGDTGQSKPSNLRAMGQPQRIPHAGWDIRWEISHFHISMIYEQNLPKPHFGI